MTRFSDLCAQVAHFMLGERMLMPAEPVLIALSGGLDSMVLLQVLSHLGHPVHAAHFDHRWRTESASEAEWLARWCQQAGISLSIGVATPETRGSEAAARAERYRFLQACAAGLGLRRVATGHHLNDQAETVLFRLARGAGLDGACGIWPQTEWLKDATIIRPLLTSTRGELEAVAQELALAHLEDPSNVDLAYRRNRIRHQVMPELAHIAPNASQNLARFADMVQDEVLLWRSLEEKWCRTWTEQVAPGCLDIDGLAFFQEPTASQQRLLRAFARELGYGSVDGATISRSLKALATPLKHWCCEWPRGARLCRANADLYLTVALPEQIPRAFTRTGWQPTQSWGWSVFVASALSDKPLHACRVRFDGSRLPKELVWRSARPESDRIKPYGHQRVRSLRGWLKQAGIPQPRQTGLLVLAHQSDIYWVVGVGRSAEALIEQPAQTPENPYEMWASAFLRFDKTKHPPVLF